MAKVVWLNETSLRFSEMPSSPIRFHFPASAGFLRDRVRLKQFIANIFLKRKKKIELINFIFCSDEFLLSINKMYLGHNYFTDTISFTLSGPGQALLGEIYISIDRVKENAKTFAVTASEELHRVIFHGSLHLCGDRDNSKIKKEKMKKEEDRLLQSYFG
jgi:probable rRNA maturation factor